MPDKVTPDPLSLGTHPHDPEDDKSPSPTDSNGSRSTIDSQGSTIAIPHNLKYSDDTINKAFKNVRKVFQDHREVLAPSTLTTFERNMARSSTVPANIAMDKAFNMLELFESRGIGRALKSGLPRFKTKDKHTGKEVEHFISLGLDHLEVAHLQQILVR